MADKSLLMRAMVLGAKKATIAPATVTETLEAVVTGHFSSVMTNGVTVVSTSEAGGSISFQIPEGLSPVEVIELAMAALSWLQMQADPNNPDLYPRTIKRLSVSFSNVGDL